MGNLAVQIVEMINKKLKIARHILRKGVATTSTTTIANAGTSSTSEHNNDDDKKEQEEISIINNFLPKQMNDDESKKICKEVIEKVGATSIKDMGKVMAVLKGENAWLVALETYLSRHESEARELLAETQQ